MRRKGTRLARSQALKTYFLFVEIRHKAQIHQMTGRVAECPVDEMNRPRGAGRAALRIPPSAGQVGVLFGGWRAELATCRKFAPAARSYAAARLMAEVGLRVNEVSHLDLADVKWDLGRFGKLHVRIGKGARGSGPRERMVPLINGAGATFAGSSRTSGPASMMITPGLVPRCSAPSAATPTGRGAGRQRDAAVRPGRRGGGAPAGLAGAGHAARAAAFLRLGASIWAGWTWSRSQETLVMPGSPPP